MIIPPIKTDVDKKEKMSDEEILFYYNIVNAGLTDDKKRDLNVFVTEMNYICSNKFVTIDDLLSVIPGLAIYIEKEDKELQCKNIGICY